MTKKEKKEVYTLVEYVKRMKPYYRNEADVIRAEEGIDSYWAARYEEASALLQYIEDHYIGEKMWRVYYELLPTEKPWEA